MPAQKRRNAPRSELDSRVGVLGEKALAEVHNLHGGDGYAEKRRKLPPSHSFTRMRRCWGLLRNFTT